MIDETVEEIQQMQTHSSSVVAVKATRALSELLERDFSSVQAYERTLEQNAGVLRRANPSHASLHNAVTDVVEGVVGETDSVEDAKERTREVIDRVVEEVRTGKRKAAERAADLFADGDTVLTHDYSSTVMDAIERAAADGVDLTVYVTEARPRYLGRKTARELSRVDGVDPHLIVDSAAGSFLPECDRVVVGMSCIVEDTLYNRVGTFPIAATAANVGTPMTVVGSAAKIVDGGFAFQTEQRPPTEVMLEPVDGVHIDNPAYDATPTDLLHSVVTDQKTVEF
jgi:translation initiation factor eIF-2B subunit delta